ncbi:MAG: LPS assembly protein LptD [Alphaproteobacteria bacterium]|nr:LPS assembly protein LptD [Alphaproteobacteria bacterium]
MKIVDKYILRQLIIGFTLILVSLAVLVWLSQSLKMIDMIVTKGVSVWIFLKMTFLVMPYFLQILMPLALFAVTLFTFIRMQSDKELMVLKAIGMSSKQMMRPVLIMASVLTVLGYILSFFVIPWSIGEIREMKWKIQNNLSHVLLQEGQFNSFGKGKMVYVRERLPNGGVKGILAYEIKNSKKTTLVADSGNLFQTPEGLDIVFGKGVRQEYDTKTNQFSILKFDKYTMSFSDQKRKAGARNKDALEMGVWYLLNLPKDKAKNIPAWRKYKVEAFERLFMPLYNFVFALLALSAVLLGTYNRQGNSGHINFIVGVALLVQTLELFFYKMTSKNLWFSILILLNVMIPIWIVLFLFKREQGKKFIKKGLFVWIMVLLLAGTAQAMPKIDTDIQKDQPVDFESDHLSFNQKTGIVTASGNVILNQNGSIVQTEEIRYDKTQNIVHIPEKALLTLADGTKAKTGQIHIFPKEGELTTGDAEVNFTDGTHLFTDKIIRRDFGKETVFENASYTPCDVCEGKSPLWRISANTIEEDEPAQTIRFWNTFFKVKDVPIAWFPYFQMPDPTVKRKTGFLLPSFGSNSEMKSHVSTPFFVNFSDNQNLTITPQISATHDPLGLLKYQGLFTEGKMDMDASLTRDDNGANQGHIKAAFKYNPNSEWRFSGQYYRTTSDTYFRRYKIEGVTETDSFLTSHLGGEYYGTRLQGSAEVLNFQSLYEDVSPTSIPIVLPIAHVDYTTAPLNENGLYAFSSADTALINNRDHFKSNRLSLTQGIKLPYISSWGITVLAEANMRMDAYSIDTGNYDIANKAKNDSYLAGRVIPQAILTVGYPLAQSGDFLTQIVEPVVQIIVAPNGSNPSRIPNVDSSVFDFSDTNLFSTNRFTGYDRIETGTRVNYGLKWSAYGRNDGPSFQALFGQTYVLRDENEMKEVMGYDNHVSNYVGRLQMTHRWVNLGYRFRFNQRNWKAHKNELHFEVGAAPLRLGINYLFQDSYRLGQQKFDEEKEITFFGRSQLTKNFSTEARYRYNLLKDKKGPLESEALLRYDNECTTFEMGVSKSFTKDRNYRGNTSVNFRLYLKTLGGK